MYPPILCQRAIKEPSIPVDGYMLTGEPPMEEPGFKEFRAVHASLYIFYKKNPSFIYTPTYPSFWLNLFFSPSISPPSPNKLTLHTSPFFSPSLPQWRKFTFYPFLALSLYLFLSIFIILHGFFAEKGLVLPTFPLLINSLSNRAFVLWFWCHNLFETPSPKLFENSY